jgi:hypothetical protein
MSVSFGTKSATGGNHSSTSSFVSVSGVGACVSTTIGVAASMTVSRSASVDELGKPLRVVRDARRGDDDRVVVREEEERPATVIDTLATTRPEPRRRAMFETLPALPATSADVVDPIVHAAPLMISPSIEDPLSLYRGGARSIL